jgi:surface carbohydrate biosynthesis protein (TIGR04326 family)
MDSLLLVSTEPLTAVIGEVRVEHPRSSIIVLPLAGVSEAQVLSEVVRVLVPQRLVDMDELRRRFLEFLDTWPTHVPGAAAAFHRRFTVDGRYSLWWTSVGADREPTHGIFKYFRYAALVDAAIQRFAPSHIVLINPEPHLEALVSSRAKGTRITVRCSNGKSPVTPTATASRRWALMAVGRAIRAAGSIVKESIRCRWILRRAALLSPSPQQPSVVFASRFDRYLELSDGRFSPVNWLEISAALSRAASALQQVYLPWKVERVVDAKRAVSGVAALQGVRAPLLIRERFLPLSRIPGSILRQAVTAWRFHKLAHRNEFRSACQFADTDLSPVLFPWLMGAVDGIVSWSARAEQFRRALSAAGSVKAVVLSEEMYRQSMPLLAAARKAGIPTIGVQHGTLMPAHLIYTVPEGHLRYAPTPDYFAAYGEFAKRTLSEHGAYPAERVWITGAARLDPLVNGQHDANEARRALDLPADRRVVVLATQTFPWFAEAIRAVIDCVRRRPDLVLCVKKNPSPKALSTEQILSMAKQLGDVDVRCFAGQLPLLLSACDVWISASSTTILEATLMGRPSICVNFAGEPDGYPYVDDGASLPARSVMELEESLHHALSAEIQAQLASRRAAFLLKHAGPTREGRGSEVFVQRLIGLISRIR